MKKFYFMILANLFIFISFAEESGGRIMEKFLTVSKKNPHYFADSNGKTYIPIGLNLCFYRPDFGLKNHNEAATFAKYREWFDKLSANGGNYARLWLGSPFFDVMPEEPGVFSQRNLERIKTVARYAEERNIKLKITLEHFRTPLYVKNGKGFQSSSFQAPVYSRYAKTMKEWCQSKECRRLYLAKAKFIADAIGNSPAVVAVDLWNEIDAIGPTYGYVGEWSDYMLKELRKIFPRQMLLQNLGSHCNIYSYADYYYLSNVPRSEYHQIHRYLDPGAEMAICQAPVDILCADSIREIRQFDHSKPIILAETGGVKANHTGASVHYDADKEGAILHDVLFAPFFAGSARTGQIWHWDSYVERWDLWWHFKRFAEAIKGIDPVKEEFRPGLMENRTCRIYVLHGKTHDLYWLRDKSNTWENEFVKKQKPGMVGGFYLLIWAIGEVDAYFPWEDRHVKPEIKDDFFCKIPEFRRSLVLRIKHNGQSRYLGHISSVEKLKSRGK